MAKLVIKMFGGRRYERYGYTNFKKDAMLHAKRLRAKGHKARVVKGLSATLKEPGFVVWVSY